MTARQKEHTWEYVSDPETRQEKNEWVRTACLYFYSKDRVSYCAKCKLTSRLMAAPWWRMQQRLGNGSNAACVCLGSSWGKFTAPSLLGYSSSFSERSPSQPAKARQKKWFWLRATANGRWMENEGSQHHVSSSDLTWYALEENKEQLSVSILFSILNLLNSPIFCTHEAFISFF